MKACSKCGHVQPLTAFYRSTRARSGYQSWCKDCMTACENRTRPRSRVNNSPARRSASYVPTSLLPGRKVCPVCRQSRELVNFHARKGATDGLQTYCIDCANRLRTERKTARDANEPSKQCCACARTLPLSCFTIDRRKKDGHHSRCRGCKSAYESVRYGMLDTA